MGLDEIKRYRAWNMSEVGPSLDWSSNDPQMLPAPYKIMDFDLMTNLMHQILITVRLICKYQLIHQEIGQAVILVSTEQFQPQLFKFMDAAERYLTDNQYQSLVVSL